MKLYIIICLQVLLVGVLWSSVGKEPDTEVLIEKYNSCNKKFQNIYYELETAYQWSSRKGVYSFKYCSNNERKQWIGHRTHYNENGTIDQGSSGLLADIYGDKMGVHLQFYNPELKSNRPPIASLTRSSRDKWCQEYCEYPPYGGSLTGLFWGSNNQSIYDLLKGASSLKSDNKITKIIGYDTCLVEADTKYGVVKAWISPDADYNCLKWEIIKGPNQYYRDGGFTNDWYTKVTAVFDVEKVAQIDGQYIVTQAILNYRVKDGNKVVANDTYHFNLNNIDLNPDYQALGAFRIQLPEGTVASHEEVPGIQFHWTNGEFIPDVNDYLIKNLMSKPLPGFSRIKTDFNPEQAAEKRVLVCFWDMQQRPSRNFIMQLANRAKQLKEKDVAVVTVQASKVDERKLNEWLKKNNIPFPAGMVQEDAEKIRLAWGVKLLPWLILTDSRHIVSSEGFGLGELDDKIKAAK